MRTQTTEGQGERQRQLRWPVFSVLTLTAGVRATVQVEERERQEANVRKSKLALIDLCRMEATKFLVHGDFELSIPGAVQALRYSLDVYGAGKIELVPSYLLLAEANLGLGRHKMAEEYLSLANWSILKNPDCSNRTKSQLYRNFGKLYASQGKHDEALRQLANDVYFSSLQVCLRVRARGRVCLCVSVCARASRACVPSDRQLTRAGGCSRWARSTLRRRAGTTTWRRSFTCSGGSIAPLPCVTRWWISGSSTWQG